MWTPSCLQTLASKHFRAFSFRKPLPDSPRSGSCFFCVFLGDRDLLPPFKNIFLMFIFERERDRVRAGEEQRERDTESEADSRLRAVSTEPDAGLELMNHEIMTWAKVRRSTDWATQAPLEKILKKYTVHPCIPTVTCYHSGFIYLFTNLPICFSS